MLKNETESKKSHRVFKFYKATGKFPPDVSGLEAYTLLAKYNYFIAVDIDKKKLSTLTEICNILDRQKILLVYGDFMLETLTFGLKNYKFSDKETKIVYIDCFNTEPTELIDNATSSNSHFGKNIIYILDNVELLTKKQLDKVLALKNYLSVSDKSLVLCCQNPADLKSESFSIKKIQLGRYIPDNENIKQYVYALFNETDRKKATIQIQEMKYSLLYLISLTAFNLNSYCEKEPENIDHNLHVLEDVNKRLYKVDSELLISYLCLMFRPIKTKRVIRFPPKLEGNNTSPMVLKEVQNMPIHTKKGGFSHKAHTKKSSITIKNKPIDKPKKKGLRNI